MTSVYKSMQDRVIANSVLSDCGHDGTPCWIWFGARTSSGYGQLAVRKPGSRSPTGVLAHRVSYEAFVGPIPEGQVIMHKCNNRLCVAPLHLVPGSQSANVRQCIADGRHNNFGRAAA